MTETERLTDLIKHFDLSTRIPVDASDICTPEEWTVFQTIVTRHNAAALKEVTEFLEQQRRDSITLRVVK